MLPVPAWLFPELAGLAGLPGSPPAALTACVILNPCLKEVVIGGVDTVENCSFRRSVGMSSVGSVVESRPSSVNCLGTMSRVSAAPHTPSHDKDALRTETPRRSTRLSPGCAQRLESHWCARTPRAATSLGIYLACDLMRLVNSVTWL